MYDAERIIFSIQYDMHTGCLYTLNDKIKLPMRHVEFMKGIFMDNITIRTAKPSDADKLLEIYAPYVEKTAITFEYEVPSVDEFRQRIENTLKKYPYIVAIKDDKIVGYAYAGTFKSRAAYDWDVELSVYLDMKCRRRGIGELLYEKMEQILAMQNIINLNACITSPSVPDEHITDDSEKFHARMGYSLVGRFHKSGYKFDTWYDMIWMEKAISVHCTNPPAVKSFPEIEKEAEKIY